MLNVTNTSIFDVFPEDLQSDDNQPKSNIFSGPGNEHFPSSNQKANHLLMIGILLLFVAIVFGCCVNTFFVCKSRKQKRLVKPTRDEIVVMTTVIVHGETGNGEARIHETFARRDS
jgi:hypothetical protein